MLSREKNKKNKKINIEERSMEYNDLISIILPVYNSEKYISTTIKSVLNQTYKNFELIIVNDGSIDKSDEICKEFAKKTSKQI